EVDLHERRDLQPPRRRLGVERVDELAHLAHRLCLAALEMADELPAKHVAIGAVFRYEILEFVFADDRDSGVCENRHVFDGDVVRRGHDRHAGADLLAEALVTLANLLSGWPQPRPAVP